MMALFQAIKDGLLDRPNEQPFTRLPQLKNETAKSNEIACKNNQRYPGL
jgi:hypothetical protein